MKGCIVPACLSESIMRKVFNGEPEPKVNIQILTAESWRLRERSYQSGKVGKLVTQQPFPLLPCQRKHNVEGGGCINVLSPRRGLWFV